MIRHSPVHPSGITTKVTRMAYPTTLLGIQNKVRSNKHSQLATPWFSWNYMWHEKRAVSTRRILHLVPQLEEAVSPRHIIASRHLQKAEHLQDVGHLRVHLKALDSLESAAFQNLCTPHSIQELTPPPIARACTTSKHSW